MKKTLNVPLLYPNLGGSIIWDIKLSNVSYENPNKRISLQG